MVLKVVESEKSEHEKRQKLGRRSKTKGNNYERDTAKRFKEAYGEELVRTPQSGGFAKKSAKANDFRGDIVPADEDIDLSLHVECKCAKTWSLPAWFKQAKEDCPEGKIPVVVFHQHQTSNDYIALGLQDFFNLVPKDKIILRKRSE